jgi:hypothetical protein
MPVEFDLPANAGLPNRSHEIQHAASSNSNPTCTDKWAERIVESCAEVTATLTIACCNLQPSGGNLLPPLSVFAERSPRQENSATQVVITGGIRHSFGFGPDQGIRRGH